MFCLVTIVLSFFFFKQKTAYEMRISDWSSDVCSSDLLARLLRQRLGGRRGFFHQGAVALRHLVHAAHSRVDLLEAGGLLARGGGDLGDDVREIGRASCRERGCQYV